VRVCLVGDTRQPLDEGMKKTSYHLARALAAYCEVLVLNPFDALSKRFWFPLIQFRPHIVHYVPGPSSRSFILLAAAKRTASAKSVMSLTHPDPAPPAKFISLFLRPDLLLAQSFQTAQTYRTLGRSIKIVPNGVDTGRFQPVTAKEKEQLRLKYDLDPGLFLILHVGNTREIRDLEIFTSLQGRGCQVLIVSSTTIRGDAGVAERLRESGCYVWQGYLQKVEEVYGLADCYVFPTEHPRGAIEHPLSVMEAMACNLPIVSRRFGALPRFFEPGDGLFFVDSDDEMRRTVAEIKVRRQPVNTRTKVLSFSWDDIARQIFSLYQAILCNHTPVS